VVSAGPDTSLRLPDNSITLAGSVADDGLPMALPSIEWTQLSGPSSAVFESPRTASTTVTFPFEGVYVLRLAAHDGELEASDDVAVTVSPEPPPSPPGEDDPGGEDDGDAVADADDAGDPDAGTVSEPAVGGGGGRFNLLGLLLLGALSIGRYLLEIRDADAPSAG
jgi:hypothetical protein